MTQTPVLFMEYGRVHGENGVHLRATRGFLEAAAIFGAAYSISKRCVLVFERQRQRGGNSPGFRAHARLHKRSRTLAAVLCLYRVRQLNGRHLRKQALLIVACDGLHFA